MREKFSGVKMLNGLPHRFLLAIAICDLCMFLWKNGKKLIAH
jgi:hypothetical protein